MEKHMGSSKDLTGGNGAEGIFVDSVPAVGIQKTIPEGIRFQIKLQRPDAPKQIYVPVTKPGGIQIDESGKLPIQQ